MASEDDDDSTLHTLIFHLHESTPRVVREVLLERGWEEFDKARHNEAEWNLNWKTSAFRISDHDNIKPWQRLNHYPGTAQMIKKDCLARHLKRMKGIYGSSYYEFSPMAFILPNDYTKFLAIYSKEKHDKKSCYWICKPTDMSRGRGIFVFKDLKDLAYDCTVIVQKYITNPLLISGYKFDLRIYVCVTCFCPLTIYVYQEGLVRFATEKFNLGALDNIFSHLTNTSINKYSTSYMADKERVGSGCKWTFGQFRSYLRSLEADDVLLWQRIYNTVMMTLLAIAPSVPKYNNCFELFGFDILIDDTLKPWLLEVNYSPALSLDCPNDITVKKSLVNDIIDLLNYKSSDIQMNNNKSVKTLSSVLHFHREQLHSGHNNLHTYGESRKNNWKENCDQLTMCSSCKSDLGNSTNRTSVPKENIENSCTCGFENKVSVESKDVQESNGKTSESPKKTLTSRLRERLNTTPRMSSLKVPSAMHITKANKGTNCIPRPADSKFAKYIPEFPLYYISDVDNIPPARVGDFLLVFPFNKTTLHASRSGDVKSIVQEISKTIQRS
ncbi:putative tubulin polyglutamylase TTLL2 [Gastrophryne carolinensis]